MLKRIVGTLSIAGVFALMSQPTAAYADDSTYLDEATQALQSTDIYVAPGVSGVGADAVATLQQHIGDNDIVIVVLPAQASSDITDLPSFTTQIAQRSGHETVLVALGDDFEAVSSALPSGTAHTLADQAESSGGSYTDELANFVTNVNNTEASIEATENPGPNVGGMVLGGAGSLLLVVALIFAGIKFIPVMIRRSKEASRTRSVAPEGIKELMRSIQLVIGEIDDGRVRHTLSDGLKHTDELFRRLRKNESSQFHEITARYEGKLKLVRNMVVRYPDIEKNPLYFADTEDEAMLILADGREAFTDYLEGTIKNISQVERGSLTDFNVSAKLLEATNPSSTQIL